MTGRTPALQKKLLSSPSDLSSPQRLKPTTRPRLELFLLLVRSARTRRYPRDNRPPPGSIRHPRPWKHYIHVRSLLRHVLSPSGHVQPLGFLFHPIPKKGWHPHEVTRHDPVVHGGNLTQARDCLNLDADVPQRPSILKLRDHSRVSGMQYIINKKCREA